MAVDEQPRKRQKRDKSPLDGAQLEELALAYVARYATTRSKLARYLRRKLRERGWMTDEPPPDIAGLTQRYAERGFVDDEAYARSKSDSLLRRGYGARRVSQALGADGVEESIRDQVMPDAAAARHAVLALARRRRFGPFAAGRPDRQLRERQIAALLRAGHSLDNARAMIDANDEASARNWASELDEDDYIP